MSARVIDILTVLRSYRCRSHALIGIVVSTGRDIFTL